MTERTPEAGAEPSVGSASPGGWAARRAVRTLLLCGVLAGITAASIAFALRVTPAQSVTVLGQNVSVGATSPTLSLSGPGELDMFGQTLPTMVHFAGPVRPRLVLNSITINSEVESFLRPGARRSSVSVLGEQLANGWKRYFAWETVFVAIGAAILLLLIAGWRRSVRPRNSMRRKVAAFVACLLVVEGVNLTLIGFAATAAPATLRNVSSLDQLVGRSGPPPVRPALGPTLQGVRLVVMGDSTAAGVGNPASPNATVTDSLCQRSSDTYAADLAQVNGWQVANLSCAGATIGHGILGRQTRGGHSLPAQLSVAERAVDASWVVLSIGANDMQWASMIRVCAVTTCTDRATAAYFQQVLSRFTQNYYDLLKQLRNLPARPNVIVNLYYSPFAPTADCLATIGLTAPKIQVLLGRLDAINSVLAGGAKTFGYLAVEPDFTGHGLCAGQPYVQGIAAAAPFHPNPQGELAIALADERVLASG